MTNYEREAATIAENVATLLHRAQMSQRGLATVTGLAHSTISHKMTGRTDWTVRDLTVIANALSVSPTELLGTLPDRDEWDRRRGTRRTPAAAGPRFLVMPEVEFDHRAPALSRPDNCHLSALT